MELDFWSKLETADKVRILHPRHGEFSLLVSSHECSRDDHFRNKAVFDVLKEAGFRVEAYIPQSDCVPWMPDSEPTMPLFLPQNPETLVQAVKEDYRSRMNVMLDRLANLHVTRSQEFGSVPYGWLMIAEMVVESFEKAFEKFPSGTIQISQIKEKFGSLRIYVATEGPEDFQRLVDRSIRWATAASTGRCAVTGRTGRIVDNGWILCLCVEAEFWFKNYPRTFNSLIYPEQAS
jgi:hypothetical protein